MLECPICKQVVARMRDGSLAMHGKPDGGLCPGTNCYVFSSGSLSVGGRSIPVIAAWIDPDADGPVEPAPDSRGEA